MQAEVRKYVVVTERTEREAGKVLEQPVSSAVACAVICNPFAGRFEQALADLFDIGEHLGADLANRAMAALGVAGTDVEAYGKAALVGEDGEREHAAALLHPKLGAGMRAVIGGGKALIPSSKAIGGIGGWIDVPLGHKDAAYVRSHFDAIRVAIADAPRRNEIVVAVALSVGGRPLARSGGLETKDVVGDDGLR